MKKKIYAIIGVVSLFLGVIGIVIPLLPTTPFLLLSAASFTRGSEKMYQWLMEHPWFGKYICDFQENKSIPLSTKIASVSLLWTTILISVFFAVKLIYFRILLISIAVLVSIHILHYKTTRALNN